jgi:hypothetical protein
MRFDPIGGAASGWRSTQRRAKPRRTEIRPARRRGEASRGSRACPANPGGAPAGNLPPSRIASETRSPGREPSRHPGKRTLRALRDRLSSGCVHAPARGVGTPHRMVYQRNLPEPHEGDPGRLGDREMMIVMRRRSRSDADRARAYFRVTIRIPFGATPGLVGSGAAGFLGASFRASPRGASPFRWSPPERWSLRAPAFAAGLPYPSRPTLHAHAPYGFRMEAVRHESTQAHRLFPLRPPAVLDLCKALPKWQIGPLLHQQLR